MPTETNDDANIDELLAELKNETSEVSDIPKKEKPKSTESDTYEIEDKWENDEDW